MIDRLGIMGWLYINTSSAAQGGGGSFKDRKEWLVGASVAESQVVGVWLFHCIEIQVFIHLPCCLSIYLTIYLSTYLTIYLSYI
jgi:hypothetical protein